MPGRVPRNWNSEIVRLAEQAAESLGGTNGSVALNKIAEHRQVHDTIFRPLLIDGALALRDSGFAMYIKSQKSSAPEFREDFYRTGGRNLPVRSRFTIAHELVHTFLYDLTSSPPTPTLKASKDDAFRKLESACNNGARRMLLPERLMKRILASEDFFVPEGFRELARAAGVALEVLVYRCKSAMKSSYAPHGGVALIASNNGKLFIQAAAVDRLAEGFIDYFSEGTELPELTSANVGRDRLTSRVEDRWSVDGRLKAPFKTRWMPLDGRPADWLLTVEQQDMPTRIG